MSKFQLSLLALFAGLGYAASGMAQTTGDPAAGKEKDFMCTGCHGIPGWRNAYPDYHVPKLGGQHAEYIVSALKAYQSGARSHATMHSIASSLSDKDMADLAAYFSSHVEK
ncbi:MAG: c-type cytochrome [Sulfuricaulis sp.]